jgi:hypothetical protein
VRRLVVIAVAASAVMVPIFGATGASATTHKTTTTTHPKKKHHKAKGITESAAGKQYLADVDAYNAASATYDVAIKSASYAQLPTIVPPLLAASRAFDSSVLRQQWPSGVKADIKTLVSADGLAEGDLQSLETANALTFSAIAASLQKDENASTQDSNIVRSDLGLLPPPTS